MSRAPQESPKWRKTSPEEVERFLSMLPLHPLLQPRKMFGYPASFVNGHFFAGMFESSILLRLPSPLKEQFPQLAGATHFNPMQRGAGMKDWWVLPESIADDDLELRKLLSDSIRLVAALPPKVKPAKKTARKSAPAPALPTPKKVATKRVVAPSSAKTSSKQSTGGTKRGAVKRSSSAK